MASSNRFSLVASAGVLHSVFHIYISYTFPKKEIISYNLSFLAVWDEVTIFMLQGYPAATISITSGILLVAGIFTIAG
ncbi:hypothetical protein KEP88_16845 [Escherichia coli]|nr:hypothetical protein [Escherichia coli]